MSRTATFLVLGLLAALAWWNFSQRSREFSGVWIDQFENSAFLEGASAQTFTEADFSSAGWLNTNGVDLGPGYETLVTDDWNDFAAYEIKFTGRRIPGSSGHLGGFSGEYVVEQVISIKRIEANSSLP